MKQILSQHIQEQKEGSSRKKAGFFSSLFFCLAMSCSIVDNRPYGCLGGYYGIESWSSMNKPRERIDFIHDSSIRDLIAKELKAYADSYNSSPENWPNIPYRYYYGPAFSPSPEEQEENKGKLIYYNWLIGETGLKEEELILDKFAQLKVA